MAHLVPQLWGGGVSSRGHQQESLRQTQPGIHFNTNFCGILFFHMTLRYNLHTIKLIHFKCITKQFLYIHRIVQPSQQPNLGTFPSPQNETSCPLAVTPHSQPQL